MIDIDEVERILREVMDAGDRPIEDVATLRRLERHGQHSAMRAVVERCHRQLLRLAEHSRERAEHAEETAREYLALAQEMRERAKSSLVGAAALDRVLHPPPVRELTPDVRHG